MKNTSIQRGSSFRLFAQSDQKFEGFRQIFEQIPRIINFKLCRLTRKKPEPEHFYSQVGAAQVACFLNHSDCQAAAKTQ